MHVAAIPLENASSNFHCRSFQMNKKTHLVVHPELNCFVSSEEEGLTKIPYVYILMEKLVWRLGGLKAECTKFCFCI